ncbi:18300_t:CDS:2 [Funneliformis geosporum]|uniref:18300_t:CDS:1 n=1 Tax=Funneliformis geosporum TaxID=1117311 RepID=A0A9W4SIZ0_9GLOM|nr:18300_t:CDS:2 [Funneliformis geosporum]
MDFGYAIDLESLDLESEMKLTKKSKKCPFPSIRSWTTNGEISPDQKSKFYYADPAETNAQLMVRILEGEFVALLGPRASENTTSLFLHSFAKRRN